MIFRWLNNNMRCFEIGLRKMFLKKHIWLNNNMRCFEIGDHRLPEDGSRRLNNNMRCFEIILFLRHLSQVRC